MKTPVGTSFRGAAGDEEACTALKIPRARFLATLRMTAGAGLPHGPLGERVDRRPDVLHREAGRVREFPPTCSLSTITWDRRLGSTGSGVRPQRRGSGVGRQNEEGKQQARDVPQIVSLPRNSAVFKSPLDLKSGVLRRSEIRSPKSAIFTVLDLRWNLSLIWNLKSLVATGRAPPQVPQNARPLFPLVVSVLALQSGICP